MEYYIGQVALFPYGYAPKGWMLCDGRTVNVKGQERLYNLIGIRFGGDGKSKFRLPDLRNVSPVPENKYVKGRCVYYICYDGFYPMRP